MKDNNGAVGGVQEYILQAFIRCQTLIEIATEDIPHDDFHTGNELADATGLRLSDPAVGWAEQPGLCKLLTLAEVVEVGAIGGGPTAEVIVGVVTDGVAVVLYLAENTGMFTDVVANAEKCGLGAVCF